MPHIVVEYSSVVADQVSIPDLLEKLHARLSGEGIDPSRIKAYAIRLDDYVVKGDFNCLVHVNLNLKQGRDVPLRQKYGAALHDVLKSTVGAAVPQCTLTVEVREMLSDTYFA
jgi:5-carboxymethyl-2-hydroxymuconate isomerase